MGVAFNHKQERPKSVMNKSANLSHFGLIQITGNDAMSFLSGLFTSDVKQVSPHLGQFSAWCDAKGRVIASFFIFMREEGYYLLLPVEMLESMVSRLKLYILRSKITINDVTAELQCLGLINALTLTQQLSLPTSKSATITTAEVTRICLPGLGEPLWVVIGEALSLSQFCEQLPEGTTSDPASWRVLEILSGLPFIVPANAGEYLPQMLNLEELGGLSYSKGCYPGQEVIARLHYRGQLKRKLYIARIENEQVPVVGAQLQHTATGECVGHLLSAARAADGFVVLQVVLEIEARQQGSISLSIADSCNLEFIG